MPPWPTFFVTRYRPDSVVPMISLVFRFDRLIDGVPAYGVGPASLGVRRDPSLAVATAVSDAPNSLVFCAPMASRCGVSAAGRPGDDPEGGLPPVFDMVLSTPSTLDGRSQPGASQTAPTF